MKQILFATSNESKVKRFYSGLLKKGIQVLSLNDLGLKIEVSEVGKNVIENAKLKALAGFEKTHIPTIGMDDSLFMENVPENEQPGLFVRRVNGKTLSDSEMIEHYSKLVKKYGVNGRLNVKWIYGLVCINSSGKISQFSWEANYTYMVETPSPKIDVGYPLNSITKFKETDEYLTDVKKDVLNKMNGNEDDVVLFIENHI